MTVGKSFKAMIVEETKDGQFLRKVAERTVTDLPPGEVLVKVLYSSLNYKDLLSATGNRGVTRSYPHTPGIDAAGVVEQSEQGAFRPGDEVIVTSYDLGMNTSGGFGQYIRVPAGWVVPMPSGLSPRESMVYGTAGFTAGLSIFRLIEGGVTPDHGEVLVTGATGGVGSIAVAILSKIGFSVTAVSSKADASDFLSGLGAKAFLSAEEASDKSGRPLLKSRWAGVVDTVGGEILATAIKSTHPYGIVTCCGNVASADLPINVYPFILRGISLVGIDSQNCPMPARKKTWEKLAGDWKIENPEQMTQEVGLEELDGRLTIMGEGKHRGRTIVRLF